MTDPTTLKLCTLSYLFISTVSNLTVVGQSSSSLLVSWAASQPQSQHTVEYRLTNQDQCKEIPDSDTQSEVASSGTTSATLMGLLPYSTYEVTVSDGTTTEMVMNGTTMESGE